MSPKTKSSQTLTEYERQRLDNIRRNHDKMSALLLRRKADEFSKNPPKPSKRPKPKPQSVIRRSLRTRGVPPSAKTLTSPPPPSSKPGGPLQIRESFVPGPHESDSDLISAILSSKAGSDPVLVKDDDDDFDPSLQLGLRAENVAKVVTNRIMSVRFLPFVDREVVVVGNNTGNLGFWDLDFAERDIHGASGDGIYVYRPHSDSISGISVHPFSPLKIFTSSYDGLVRLMDVEKENFNMLTSSDCTFSSICQWPLEVHCLHIAERGGMLKVWDEREGKGSSFWQLHEASINTIDFSPKNPHLMATSSSDRLASIWDLRSMKKDKPDDIYTLNHGRAVQSAYFSPNGKCLATTSLDDKIGIASGSNFEDLSMVWHYNLTGIRPTFRAIWGWNDLYVYIGNMDRSIDVISTTKKTTISLDNPTIMNSIPCRFAAHPYKLGHLAGTTSGGKVFLWTMG